MPIGAATVNAKEDYTFGQPKAAMHSKAVAIENSIATNHSAFSAASRESVGPTLPYTVASTPPIADSDDLSQIKGAEDATTIIAQT